MSVDSDYLDLAIGLAVVFFLASLVVSGLNEAFAWLTRRRAKFLWAWLHNLVSTTNDLTWKPGDLRPSGTGTANPSGSPADITARLLDSLASVSPTGASDKQTTIKHIPPSSLAQAFLEVFSDLGRETLATQLPALLAADADERARAASALTALLARPPERPASEVRAAFQTFVDEPPAADDEAARAAAVDGLANALGELSGAQSGPALRTALDAFVAGAPDQRTELAEPVITALARTFPDVLVRERLQASIHRLEGTPLAPTLNRLWESATGEMDKFRLQFQQWLQGELDRLGGFYKRSIRWITLLFVVGVTVVLNIDAIGVTQSLWRHPDGRTALVGYAQQLGADAAETAPPASAPPGSTPTSSAPTPAESGLAAVQAACIAEQTPATTVPPAGAATTTADPDAAAKTFTEISDCVTDAVNALSGLNVIDAALVVDAGEWWSSWTTWGWSWWRHLLGLIATGAALFLGAPFWFDIVKRLTGMRKGLVGDT